MSSGSKSAVVNKEVGLTARNEDVRLFRVMMGSGCRVSVGGKRTATLSLPPVNKYMISREEKQEGKATYIWVSGLSPNLFASKDQTNKRLRKELTDHNSGGSRIMSLKARGVGCCKVMWESLNVRVRYDMHAATVHWR